LLGQADYTHSHTGSEPITTTEIDPAKNAQLSSQFGEASKLANQENKPADVYSATMDSAMDNGGSQGKTKMMVARTESKSTSCGCSKQDHFKSCTDQKCEIIDEGSGGGYSIAVPFAESSYVGKTCGNAEDAINIEAPGHKRGSHGRNNGMKSDVTARPDICTKLVEDGCNNSNSALTAANLRRDGSGGISDQGGEAAVKVSPIEIIGQFISS
jgi:hypothetical protein